MDWNSERVAETPTDAYWRAAACPLSGSAQAYPEPETAKHGGMDRTGKNRRSAGKSKTRAPHCRCAMQSGLMRRWIGGKTWPELHGFQSCCWAPGWVARATLRRRRVSREDKTLKLSVEGAFSRGVGEGVINFGGRIEVLAKTTPDDFRSVDLEREHLTQTWINGRDLKLRMYREREGNAAPHGYIELLLETRQSSRDELEYTGSYVLTVFHLKSGQDSEGKTLSARGKAKCSAG